MLFSDRSLETSSKVCPDLPILDVNKINKCDLFDIQNCILLNTELVFFLYDEDTKLLQEMCPLYFNSSFMKY